MELQKGKTYNLTISGVDLTGKITSAKDGIFRVKIMHARLMFASRQSYSILTFAADQVTKADLVQCEAPLKVETRRNITTHYCGKPVGHDGLHVATTEKGDRLAW